MGRSITRSSLVFSCSPLVRLLVDMGRIVGCSDVSFSLPTKEFCRCNLQSILQMLVNLHNGCLVTTSVAIVWCTEYGYHISILAPIVSLHHQLMCTCYQCQTIIMIESFRDILSECISCSSWTYTPTTSIIRIRP